MTTAPQPSTMQRIFSRKMLICIFTGFTSGLPLYFLINLIPAWLRSEHIDLKTIGLMALIGLPFTWKFIWSPVIDLVRLPFLGRRRGWMLVTQIGLLLALLAYAFLNPAQHLYVIMGLSLVVAFFSASQDIVLDAFRREILSDEELGLGNSIHVNAYRIAALVPGSLSLILADLMPWHNVFIITALFMLPGLLMTLFLAKNLTFHHLCRVHLPKQSLTPSVSSSPAKESNRPSWYCCLSSSTNWVTAWPLLWQHRFIWIWASAKPTSA